MPGVVSFRRALILSTASSALVPVIGVVTAPVLAQSLGVAGRGEVAAAIGPGLLIATAATLGLPEALTFELARRPQSTRVALRWTVVLCAVIGALCLTGVFLASSVLANGDRSLARLIVLATALSVPALLVNLLRGAAAGRQMWVELTTERVLNAVLRFFVIIALAWWGRLTVTSAVLIMAIAPIVGGAVYWRLLLARPGPVADGDDGEEPPQKGAEVGSFLLKYGSKIWLGSVATMVMARLSQFVVVPLSDVQQLGLLIVAITIADVPFILSATVRDVLFTTDSAEANPERLATVSRLTLVLSLAGSLAIGTTLPLWISPLFGAGFEGAIVPTWITLASQVISVPGLMIGAGLASSGRPGLRSVAIVIAVVGNLLGLVLLVPPLGAVGAALAGVAGSVLSLVLSLVLAGRLLGLSVSNLVVPKPEDLTVVLAESRRVLRQMSRMRSRSR